MKRIPSLALTLFFLTSSFGLQFAQAQLASATENLPGAWTQGSFSNDAGSRDYYLYVPKNSGTAPLPLYVMLHGCETDAPSFAATTGMRELGEQYGFAVLFPVESSSANIFECWNWFDPSNFKRGKGEISIIVGMIGVLQGQINLDMSRVYVGGISAGAGLAADLIACYSDVFSGALIASGLEFEAADSAGSAFSVMSNGSSKDPNQAGIDAAHCTGTGARVSAVMIIHGSQDTTVSPTNSTQVLQQMTKMNDIIDDGQDNDSQTTTVIQSKTGTSPGGENFTTETYGGQGKTHILNVTVDGMAHAWSGAHQLGQFADPNGPDASLMMVQFFSGFGAGFATYSAAKP